MSAKTPLEEAEAFLEANRSQPDKMTVATAWNGSQHVTYGTLRALVAQIRLDEQRLVDRGRLIAENRTLRTAITEAAKVIRPLWDALIVNITPLLNAVEPLLESDTVPERERIVYDDPQLAERIHEGIAEAQAGLTADLGDFSQYAEPHHGDLGVCKVCGDTIEFFESTATNGDVLDTWWSHRTHPADGHDAVPQSSKPAEPKPPAGVCKVCDGRIYYREEIAGTTGAVATHWWEHVNMPRVAHNAAPVQSVCTYPVGRGAEGTAPCGYPVILCEFDGSGRRVPTWRHVDMTIEAMHIAEPGPPGFQFVGTAEGGVTR